MNYCHNCLTWSWLADKVFCQPCLSYWYVHKRFPLKGEKT